MTMDKVQNLSPQTQDLDVFPDISEFQSIIKLPSIARQYQVVMEVSSPSRYATTEIHQTPQNDQFFCKLCLAHVMFGHSVGKSSPIIVKIRNEW